MIADQLVLTYVGMCALMVGLGVPLALGRVPPNPLYGFRTPATQADPRLWYPVNVRTGVDMIGCGLVVGILAWVLPRALPALPPDTYMGLWTAGFVASLLFVVVRAGLLLRRLSRALPPPDAAE